MGDSNAFVLFQTGEKLSYMLVSNCYCLGASGTSGFREAFSEHFSDRSYPREILF